MTPLHDCETTDLTSQTVFDAEAPQQLVLPPGADTDLPPFERVADSLRDCARGRPNRSEPLQREHEQRTHQH